MTQSAKPIAVLQGASTPEIQAAMARFARSLPAGVRVAGVVEDDANAEGEVCGAGRLRSLRDGTSWPIFQELGGAAGACRLDANGVVDACVAVRRDIEAGCDLVILSKFARIEADQRSGLMDAFAAAIEAQVPILTAVSPKFMPQWERFAGALFELLPPDDARLAVWWATARAGAAAA